MKQILTLLLFAKKIVRHVNSPGTQQTTSLMHTERVLCWHTRNRYMKTNLVCPISWLIGGMRLGYTTIQRLHHRQTRSHGTDGWMLVKIINEWLCNPNPYPVHVWKQFWDIRIRLQTHYPAGYPTGKPDSDHLWYKGMLFPTVFCCCFHAYFTWRWFDAFCYFYYYL